MSDHISGPRALAEPIADITDVYAFPSPETPGDLVLVINTLPFAPPDGRFSDGLIYRFRLRPLTPAGGPTGSAPFHVGTEELVFDCVFSDQSHGAGREDGRSLAVRGATRARPRSGRSGARCGPEAQQRLPLRR